MFKYVTTLFSLACVSALDVQGYTTTIYNQCTGTGYPKGSTARINCCNNAKYGWSSNEKWSCK